MKKGFTLVELLAVIAILAIILLIAVPQVLGVIEDAKKDSFRNSVRSIFGAIQLTNMRDDLMSGTIESLDLGGEELTGTWQITNDGIILNEVSNGTYCVTLTDANKATEFDLTAGSCAFVCEPLQEERPSSDQLLDQLIFDINNQNKQLNCKHQQNFLTQCVKIGGKYSKDCYFKGGKPNNVVWTSGRLWNIMGINPDGTIKMVTVKPQTAKTYEPSSNHTWENSYAQKWLNESFYDSLSSYLKNNMVSKQWDITPYDETYTRQTEKLSESYKVGLISYYEYLKASEHYTDGITGTCLNGSEKICGVKGETAQNFLYRKLYQWTLSPFDNNNTEVWHTLALGPMDKGNADNSYSMHPVINVNSNLIIASGNGNSTTPYTLSGDTTLVNTLANAPVGSFVTFSNYTWRIVSHTNKETKLIMNDVLRDTDNQPIKIAFDTDNTKLFDPADPNNIGYYLNTTWTGLDLVKERLITTTWSLGKYNWGAHDYADEQGTVSAKIGLIRVGEQFASKFIDFDKQYWTLTPRGSNNNYVWGVDRYGYLSSDKNANELGQIVPVIVLSSSETVSSGTGTITNSYMIE